MTPSLDSLLLTISQHFFLLSFVLGLNTLPGALAFCMAYAWLGELPQHTILSHWLGLMSIFCESCFLLHPCSTSSLCLCVHVICCPFLCVLPFVLCFVLCLCLFLAPNPSLFTLLLSLHPLWWRCFRWHPQTHSGVLIQSGHDPEWPTASQTGVQWPRLVTG